MIEIKNEEKVYKMREYFLKYMEYYNRLVNEVGIEIKEKDLKELIENAQIKLFENNDTTGTFQVSQLEKSIKVIYNNFEKNGKERNNFLLLHEFTHLASQYHKTLFSQNQRELINKLNNYETIKALNNSDYLSMGGFDVRMGLIAIEEVLAQWTAERLNEKAEHKPHTEKHSETHTILENDLKFNTDFNNKDIYAPLEEPVENLAKIMGFLDMKDFAVKMISGEKNIFDYINEENVEQIGCIGILCEGIYQENGFDNFDLPSSDIPKADKFLKSISKTVPEAPTEPNGFDR